MKGIGDKSMRRDFILYNVIFIIPYAPPSIFPFINTELGKKSPPRLIKYIPNKSIGRIPLNTITKQCVHFLSNSNNRVADAITNVPSYLVETMKTLTIPKNKNEESFFIKTI